MSVKENPDNKKMCVSTKFLHHEINIQSYVVFHAVKIDTLATNFEKNKNASKINIYPPEEKILILHEIIYPGLTKI